MAQELEYVVRAQIPRHHLHPHDHVDAGPRLGLEAEQRELRRQPSAVVRDDEGVDAGDVGVDLLLRPVGRRGPRVLRRASESDRAEKAVLRERGCAENLREAPVADAPLQLHLPEPVLRVHVAEAEERVQLVRGVDVRNRVGVADDVDRRREPQDGQRAVDLRQRSAQIMVTAGDAERGEQDDRPQRFQHESHETIIINSQLSTLKPNSQLSTLTSWRLLAF